MKHRESLPLTPVTTALSAAVTAAVPAVVPAAVSAVLPAAVQLQSCLHDADPVNGLGAPAAHAAALLARDLAGELGRSADQARAGAWQCLQLLRMGRNDEVLTAASAVLALMDEPSVAKELADMRRELLRTVTLAGSEAGAFDQALDAAHELVRSTAGLGEDGPALNAAFALAACFERMGDSWQAGRVLTEALALHGEGAAAMPRLVATNGLCAISIGVMHRLRDTDAEGEAQAMLERARAAGERAHALLAQVPDPSYEVAVLGNLGEVMLHQGDATAAEPLLRQAAARAEEAGLQAHAWRVRATWGDWLLAMAGPSEALAAMRTLLAELGPAGSPQTALRAHHTAYRACRALGDFAQALTHFEAVSRLERTRVVTQLRAQSRLFVTRTEAQHAQWQAEQARQDAQHHRARAAEFAASAERDPLTGLGNRRHLERRCAELLPAALRDRRALTLAQLDIDHFKAINDSHGHAAGDRVLVALAHLLRENTRERDVLARHGGEEFIVMLPGMALPAAAEVCERLRERVASHPWHELGMPGLKVTLSIGLAAAPPYDAGALMHAADLALYAAKRGGRNRLVVVGAD